MGERHLSTQEIEALAIEDQKTARYFRACIKRNNMHTVNTRDGGDRRIALFSYVPPEMERRSGFDRRR